MVTCPLPFSQKQSNMPGAPRTPNETDHADPAPPTGSKKNTPIEPLTGTTVYWPEFDGELGVEGAFNSHPGSARYRGKPDTPKASSAGLEPNNTVSKDENTMGKTFTDCKLPEPNTPQYNVPGSNGLGPGGTLLPRVYCPDHPQHCDGIDTHFTKDEMPVYYKGKDPWRSARKSYKLLSIACNWHLVRINPSNTPNMAALHNHITRAVPGTLIKIPGSNNPDFKYLVHIVWNTSVDSYTTLDDSNLREALELMEASNRYSILLLTLAARKPWPRYKLPEQVAGPEEKAEDGEQSQPVEQQIPLKDMLMAAWEAYVEE